MMLLEVLQMNKLANGVWRKRFSSLKRRDFARN